MSISQSKNEQYKHSFINIYISIALLEISSHMKMWGENCQQNALKDIWQDIGNFPLYDMNKGFMYCY